MKKFIIIIFTLIAVVAGFYYRIAIKDFLVKFNQSEIPVAIEFESKTNVATQYFVSQQNQKSMNEDQVLKKEIEQLPVSFNLDVPFTSQAPFADWNETFKEACEEASILIVDYFYNNKKFTPQNATDEILKMVDWQLDYFGGHFDLTVNQTSEMIKKYLGYEKVEIISNPTIEKIKTHISQQRPVIIPAAGRELGNPYFTQPGPIYHMLVIKGYTESKFITNDPGTKRGKDFLYDYDIIMNSIHDWNKDEILNGPKKIIVIYPNL